MKRPPGTNFCCGVPYPKPQCDDCPMKQWELSDANDFAAGIVADHNRRDPKLAGKMSRPTERYLNLALAFLGLKKRRV